MLGFAPAGGEEVAALSFMTCRQCGREWPERESFLADAELHLSGCQIETDAPAASAFLFDHKAPGCGTTLAVSVKAFDDLYAGPRHKVDWAPSAKCPGMCLDPENLEACPAECRSAYVRHILQAVRSLAGG